MTFIDWVEESKETIDRFGWGMGSKFAAQEFLIGAGRRLGQRLNYGRNYWERDWEVLILLDACRYDLMQEVASEYDFLPDELDYVYSPASMSEEFLERHVKESYLEEIKGTTLVSANAFTRNEWVQDAPWFTLDEPWKHSWDSEKGTVLPRDVTESAIYHWRNTRSNRMIVWYIQPHAPFVRKEWSDGFDSREIGKGNNEEKESVWYRHRNGEIPTTDLLDGYRDNLRYVLDDVQVLLENIDSDDLVISSDHANCIGEWGIHGHPKYVPSPTLKRVPWVPVAGKDLGTLSVSQPERQDVDEGEIHERLEALGYK